MEKIEGKGDA